MEKRFHRLHWAKSVQCGCMCLVVSEPLVFSLKALPCERQRVAGHRWKGIAFIFQEVLKKHCFQVGVALGRTQWFG